jgi:hypothetical protein
LRKLVKLVENITGTEDNDSRGYDYIQDLVMDISDKNMHLDDIVTKNLYNKLLISTLSDEEYEEFIKRCPNFPQPCIIIIFKGEQIPLNVIELLLNKENITNEILLNADGNIVLFLKYIKDESYENIINTKMLNIASNIKEQGLKLDIAVSFECKTIYEVSDTYKKTLKMFRFIDYEHVIHSRNASLDENYEYSVDVEENRRLYELILSGNATAAKQIIYKQWYELMQVPYFDNRIEQLFFSHKDILSSAAKELNYNISLPQYNNELVIKDIAFLIADVVDDLCNYVVKREQENDRDLYNIKLALHPDDPPVPRLGGVSRIMISYENIKKAISVVNSCNLGVTMCQATYHIMGENLYEIIPKLNEKIFFIHFRNTTGNKKKFRETFHDNGEINMKNILELYRKCGINVPIRVDHVPTLAGESDKTGYSSFGRLFALGYLKGLLEIGEENRR